MKSINLNIMFKNTLSYVQKVKLGVIVLLLIASLPPACHAQCWQNQKVVADDRGEFERTGGTVAFSGNYAVAGAPGTRFFETPNVGSISIFEKHGQKWDFRQQTRPNLAKIEGTAYGSSVAIENETMVVGAPGWGDLHAVGGVFILERQKDGSWKETQTLRGLEQPNQNYFGYKVAISGDWIAVSSPYCNDFSQGILKYGVGAIFMYKKDSYGTWRHHQTIFNPSSEEFDFLGGSIALRGNQLIASVKQNTVFLYELSSLNKWQLKQPFISELNINFGYSIALSDEHIAISAPYNHANKDNNQQQLLLAGSVYIFSNNSSLYYPLEAHISSMDLHAFDEFGSSIALHEHTLIVGAQAASRNENDGDFMLRSGEAYQFEFVDDNWQQIRKILAPDRGSMDAFGTSVAFDGECLMVGAPLDGHGSGSNDFISQAGSCYFFQLVDDFYCQEQECQAPAPNPSSNEFKIGDWEQTSVTLIDLQGRTSILEANHGIVRTESLPAGIYLLRSGSCTHKIVKID
jgi:hypothetical protein